VAKRGDALGRWVRHSATGRFLASHVGALYIRLVNRTTRWQLVGREEFDEQLAKRTGIIPVMWHGRLFMTPIQSPNWRRAVAMISNNRDGDLISAVIARFGAFSVRGSSYDHEKQRDKGGAVAFAGAQRELTENHAVVAITPDGPRGPRMRAQRGAAILAIATQSPVQTVTFSTVRGKTLRNWDRFLIPWPFGRGVQIFGELIIPPESDDDASVDALLRRIEEELTEITNRADDMCGRPRVGQGPPLGGA